MTALLLAQIDAVADYLADREDVVDGDDGRPEANEEMGLLRELRAARDQANVLLLIAQSLAKLRDGLDNSNSSAEWAAARLAGQAQASLARMGAA